MRQRTMALGAPRSLHVAIVALAIFILGGCREADRDTGQDAGQDADAIAAAGEATSQTQAAAGCWIRGGDPSQVATRPSPLDSTEVTLDAGTIKVCYSRPQRRGRTIFGDLEPFGEPWRLGANEATAIYVSAPATIGDVDVEPGWYTLYAIPGETEWQMVVNADTERWGIPINEDVRARDVGSNVVPVERPDAPVETLTMTLERTSPTEATLTTEWEEARVSVPIQMR